MSAALRLRWWRSYSALALCVGVAVLLLLTGAASAIEEDFRQSREALLPHRASGNILLVEIDAKSLGSFGQWPWPRRLHAAMIDRLDHLGCTTVAFDVDFSARSNAQDDDAMAAALDRAKAVVILPTFRQPLSNGSNAFTENLPIEPFRQRAMLASVNVSPDANGQLASYPYGTVTGGMARPSLAAMLANVSGATDKRFRIDTSLDPATLPRISAADLLGGRVDPARVSGKQVVIGATAIELGDRYATPRHGVIPGALIQMLAAETLLRGSQLPAVGPLAAVLATLAVIALLGRIRRSSRRTLARCVWTVALLTAPALSEGIGWPSIEVIPAMLVLGAEFAWASVTGFAARLQTERHTDALTGLPNARAFERHNADKGAMIVVVVRFMWFEEMEAQLDDAKRALWLQRTLDRLSLGLPGQIYHLLAPGIFAWSEVDAEPAALIARIESTSALFRAPLQLGSHQVLVTPGFGICAGAGASSRKIVAQALLAARQSQETGQSWSIHSDKSSHDIERALTLLADVQMAIEEGQIRVDYQPKWSIGEKQICGAEALVRWTHPKLGAIAPDDFIPLLETSGNLARLTLAIVDLSLKDLASWHAAGRAISVAINISASLLEDAQFVRDLHARLECAGPILRFVTLEVTESAAVNQTKVAVAVLTSFRAMGIRISIDDYGTGRATLAYLKAFPADEVKIDKSFITNIRESVSDQILVRSTIELARELKFKVVAEGVEDAACLALLAEYGCDIAQGWHVDRPMAAQLFMEKWIQPMPDVKAELAA